jgi:hypothetical protein
MSDLGVGFSHEGIVDMKKAVDEFLSREDILKPRKEKSATKIQAAVRIIKSTGPKGSSAGVRKNRFNNFTEPRPAKIRTPSGLPDSRLKHAE